MLLKQQCQQPLVSYESEAFCATIVQFKIRLAELQIAAGVSKSTIERFKLGFDEISTEDLGAIIKALTPKEQSFYNSMVRVQGAAAAAGVQLPLLDFSKPIARRSDIYRDALELTLKVFGLQQKDVYVDAGIHSSNFSSWFKGNRDVSLSNLRKMKASLSHEQRSFMESVSDIFVAIEPLPNAKEVKSNKQLSIA